MSILIVGGAGYIGSHTCKAFSQAGYEAYVLDNLSIGHREFVKWGPLIEADLLDRTSLAAAFSSCKFDAVIHFAALAYVGESVRSPATYYRNNVAGTINLLDAMIQHDVKRIVFSSTCATYGNVVEVPISETTPQKPINPYGHSKLMVEQILRDYDTAYGMKSVSLRYFNACGADPDGELGERHDPEVHLIPLAIEAAMGRRSNLTIFGSDYPTPDGTAIRDYVHVSDLARAHVSALSFLENGGRTDQFNLGTGRGYSVMEIVDTINEVSGTPVPHEYGQRRPGDPPELVADSTRARQILGFEPTASDITSIIRTAWDWHSGEIV